MQDSSVDPPIEQISGSNGPSDRIPVLKRVSGSSDQSDRLAVLEQTSGPNGPSDQLPVLKRVNGLGDQRDHLAVAEREERWVRVEIGREGFELLRRAEELLVSQLTN